MFVKKVLNDWDNLVVKHYFLVKICYKSGGFVAYFFLRINFKIDVTRWSCFVTFYSCDENSVINRLNENGIGAYIYSKCE